MIAVALFAVLLALALWTVRYFEAQVMRERMLAARARDQAVYARDLAQVRSAQASIVAANLGNAEQPKTASLWAGLSVNHAIFKAGQTRDLIIEFTLVNDGDNVIDPKIEDSRIVIKGKERTDSGMIISGVQKGSRFKALSPGDSLQFSLPLGDWFMEPGTYRIAWKGDGYHSPEIVLRIMPEGAR